MKTFVIRLSGHALSTQLADEVFEAAVKLNYNPEFFEGVTPKRVDQFFEQKGLFVCPEDQMIKWTHGTKGCLASHWSIWEMVAESDEPVVVLEHDGLPIRDVTPIVPLVKDVCHLDRFIPFSTNIDNYFDIYSKHVQERFWEGVIPYPKEPFYDTIVVTGSSFRGTYGYIVTPSGARKLLQFGKTHGVFPSDRIICENAVELQRANGTYVRLHPFFKDLDIQRKTSTRYQMF